VNVDLPCGGTLVSDAAPQPTSPGASKKPLTRLQKARAALKKCKAKANKKKSKSARKKANRACTKAYHKAVRKK
jgi:hypothetical protein